MAFLPGGSTITDAYGLLKEYYSSRENVANMIFKNRPLWALMPKRPDFSGKTFPVPIITASSQGGSAIFSNAQTNQSPLVAREFQLPAFSYYQLATVSNALRQASRNDAGAFVNEIKVEIDSAMMQCSNTFAQLQYGKGTGVLSTVGAITGGVITLASPSDAFYFQTNQVLDAVTTAGAVRPAIGYVVSLDSSLGTVTVSATQGGAAGNPGSWAATDQLVQDGNYNVVPTGLAGWLPSTNRPVSGGSQAQNVLYGVDRSIDVQKLAGTFYDGSNETLEETIIDGLSEVWKYGGNPDVVMMNPVNFRSLQKAEQSRRYIKVEAEEANISFNALEFMGDNGPVAAMSDPYCPAGLAYALQLDTWFVASYDDAPTILTYEDGITAFRVNNADSLEARIGAYFNFGCTAPGWNGVFKLPAA